MDRELLVAHSGGKLLPERVLFLETKEHPQISKASFWKRGRENVFLQMFYFGENESTPQPMNGNKVVGAVMLLPKFLSRKISPEKSLDFLSRKSVLRPALGRILMKIFRAYNYN